MMRNILNLNLFKGIFLLPKNFKKLKLNNFASSASLNLRKHERHILSPTSFASSYEKIKTFGNFRHFSAVLANDLRAGMVFIYNGKYCEVTDYRQIKQGRTSASANIEYIELATQKIGQHKFSCQMKVDKVELDKQNVSLMYVDKENKRVVVADETFDELDFPLDFIQGAEGLLEPGMKICIFKHNDKVVKVGLPSAVLAKLRKK